MLILPRFVFINGPSGSGKSTLARLLCESTPGCWQESFAEPIREMIRTVFFPEEGPITYTHDLKDGPTKRRPLLEMAKIKVGVGVSLRRAMIDFSEEYMKPRFGHDIYGQLLLKRCQEQETWYTHFIIDDSGFAPEAQPIIDQIGAQNCALIHLHRSDATFAGDSRGYVDLPGVRKVKIINDGAPAEMLSALQLEFGNL